MTLLTEEVVTTAAANNNRFPAVQKLLFRRVTIEAYAKTNNINHQIFTLKKCVLLLCVCWLYEDKGDGVDGEMMLLRMCACDHVYSCSFVYFMRSSVWCCRC